MTVPTAVRPRPSALQQWWVLTVRSTLPTLRNGELLTTIAAAGIFTAGFYIPLNKVMVASPLGMSSYAQFLMPLIALQAISFIAISSAFRAATDAVQGINRRFGSMPIAPLTPLAARMSANMCRCAIGLAVAILCGYAIGFRFDRSVEYIVAFCVLALLIGATLSFLGDLLGTLSKNPEATSTLLALPHLILGLLSVGIQPAERFPNWIQPIVRNQPVSQFVYALRALAGDTTAAAPAVIWSVMGPPLAWLLGLMLISVPLSAFVLSRRR
jgi:ABC-2 type transport system permease protein